MIDLFDDAIVFIAGALFGLWLTKRAVALWTNIKAMFAKKGA